MKVPFTNTKDHPVTIGMVTLAPGATRSVEQTMVPGYRPAKASAQSDPVDPVGKFLGGKATDIIKSVPEQDTGLLQAAAESEADGKARKTVLEAIEAQLLERAAQAADGQGGDDRA